MCSKLRVTAFPEELRNTTQNRSPDHQLVQRSFLATDNTDCTDYNLRRTNSLSERHYLLFHCSTHARTNTNQNGTACSSLPSGLTAVLSAPVLPRYEHTNSEQGCTNCFARRTFGFIQQELTLRALSRKYRVFGRLVSKIENLYFRTELTVDSYGHIQ